MDLQFERSCQYIGNSKAVIIPREMLEALEIDAGDKVILRYYEKIKENKKRKYVSFWKKGE